MDTLRQIRLVWKPLVFIVCLLPFALVVGDTFEITGSLGANPVEEILDRLGNWSLRLILIALAVTPLRRLTGWNWLSRFRRDFLRGWINFVPYAYHIGVVDGHQVVDLEIAPDGRLLSLQVVERDGHDSLEEATLANFRSFAPYHPLSADGSFPEETLRLRATIFYPDH